MLKGSWGMWRTFTLAILSLLPSLSLPLIFQLAGGRESQQGSRVSGCPHPEESPKGDGGTASSSCQRYSWGYEHFDSGELRLPKGRRASSLDYLSRWPFAKECWERGFLHWQEVELDGLPRPLPTLTLYLNSFIVGKGGEFFWGALFLFSISHNFYSLFLYDF